MTIQSVKPAWQIMRDTKPGLITQAERAEMRGVAPETQRRFEMKYKEVLDEVAQPSGSRRMNWQFLRFIEEIEPQLHKQPA